MWADMVVWETMGGLQVSIDYAICVYINLANLAMLILPGGASWQEAAHNEIASYVKKVKDAQIPAAAIFCATIFLGRHGLLDNVMAGESILRAERLDNTHD